MYKINKKAITIILFSSILIFSFAGCTAQKQVNKPQNSNPVKIQYLGHAAFVFSDQKGTKVGTDFWTPGAADYAEDIPSNIGITEKDNLTRLLISHNHHDHDYVPFKVSEIRGTGGENFKENPEVDKFNDVVIGKYKGYHGSDSAKIGLVDNATFTINMNDVKIVHL